jgi:hypothetical protein
MLKINLCCDLLHNTVIRTFVFYKVMICLSVYLSVCVYLFIYLSVYSSVCPSVYLSVYPSYLIYLSVNQSVSFPVVHRLTILHRFLP